MVRKYIQKLTDSGYNTNQRMEILRSGCVRFCRRQIEDLTGGRKLYRMEREMKSARKAKKFRNQYWFKSSRGGSQLTPKKDLPFNIQEKELTKRKRSRRTSRDKVEKETDEVEPETKKAEPDTETGSSYWEGSSEGKIKEIEAVLFIPSTPDSKLRKRIQKAQDQAARMMNTPTVRVVEWAGTKIMEEIGDNNP